MTEESNTSGSFTKILRSSRTTVKEAQEESISALPRRSTRLVSKVAYPFFCSFGGEFYMQPCEILRYTNTIIIPLKTWICISVLLENVKICTLVLPKSSRKCSSTRVFSSPLSLFMFRLRKGATSHFLKYWGK